MDKTETVLSMFKLCTILRSVIKPHQSHPSPSPILMLSWSEHQSKTTLQEGTGDNHQSFDDVLESSQYDNKMKGFFQSASTSLVQGCSYACTPPDRI